MERISYLNKGVVPQGARRLLFEKELTESDVGNVLVIPKRYAREYFPQVEPDSKGVLLSFHDVENNLWKFRYLQRKGSKRIYEIEEQGTHEDLQKMETSNAKGFMLFGVKITP
ncbi:AP2/ERF and B3 domain-containing transcription factor like protein [Tanacetum coccineum]